MRGAHVTAGSRGVTRTVGLPGTGVFYTSRSGDAFVIGLIVGVGIVAAVVIMAIIPRSYRRSRGVRPL
jgi:hypothetical protein